MCGILGTTRPFSRSVIQKALQEMNHRGQDGCGIFVNEKVSLGHVRLSIIGLESITYPISNENSTVYVVVNGEFYDHVRIRKELESKGHRFSTLTDAEILVHLYEEYGLDCMQHLNGEFAFLLYDVEKNQLIAGRDRFGIKPLHYVQKEDDVYFSSEMKSLLALGVESVLDYDSLLVSSAMQYTLPDKTLFQGIYSVMPGHLCLVDLNTKKIQKMTYWDIDFQEGEFSEKNLKEILIDSVKTRLVSDVPLCCALSGGIDSSLVYGIANSFQKTNAVTVEFENSSFNESEIARRTTDFFGTDLHVLQLNSEKVMHHLSDAVYYSEGLTINSHLVAKFLLSRLIQEKGYKVVLTGEGSDELFAGYPHFKKDLSIHYEKYNQENQLSAGIMNNGENPLGYIQGYEQALGFIPEFLKVKSSFGNRVLGLYRNDFISDFSFDSIPHNMMAYFNKERITQYNKANTSAYLWAKIVLSNYILRTLADGTEMAHTVEGRVPFLDVRLWNEAGKMPMNKKLEGTIEKKILREIGASYLTEEVKNRTKQPFITPPFLVKEKEYLYDHLDQLPSFFDQRKVKQMMDNLYTNYSLQASIQAEPILFFILSLHHLMQRFHMKSR